MSFEPFVFVSILKICFVRESLNLRRFRWRRFSFDSLSFHPQNLTLVDITINSKPPRADWFRVIERFCRWNVQNFFCWSFSTVWIFLDRLIYRRISPIWDSQMLRLLSKKCDSIKFRKFFFEDWKILWTEKSGDDCEQPIPSICWWNLINRLNDSTFIGFSIAVVNAKGVKVRVLEMRLNIVKIKLNQWIHVEHEKASKFWKIRNIIWCRVPFSIACKSLTKFEDYSGDVSFSKQVSFFLFKIQRSFFPSFHQNLT